MAVATVLTEEEFLNLPEFTGKQELLDGELIELPPARYAHTELVMQLVELLRTVLPRPRVLSEGAYRLRRGRWLVPDVSVTWPGQPLADGWLQGSPMLAIEVASRGNTAAELEQKVVACLENGAAEAWVIYPKTRTMMVFRPGSTTHVGATSDYNCELLGVVVTPQHRTPRKTRSPEA